MDPSVVKMGNTKTKVVIRDQPSVTVPIETVKVISPGKARVIIEQLERDNYLAASIIVNINVSRGNLSLNKYNNFSLLYSNYYVNSGQTSVTNIITPSAGKFIYTFDNTESVEPVYVLGEVKYLIVKKAGTVNVTLKQNRLLSF
jgi:hypothetical protein